VLIIAIPREDDPLLNQERERLSTWAPANGWNYIEYIDSIDLLARLIARAKTLVREIEIIAHGNPAECNDVLLENVRTFGESLHRVPSFSRGTVVYLSGCNTGLEFGGDCIARALAEACEATVCGAQGYLAGTHAENNERCVPEFTFASVAYEGFPGAIEATGDAVWRKFGPPLKAANGDDMDDIKISTSGFRPVNLAREQVAQLRAAVEEAIRQPAAEPAPFRIAPDLRFTIRLADGEHIFELLAGGTVLRDPVVKRVWQLPGGRALLESLWPFRSGALPAA
jgi:hypothetical protein